MKCFPAILLRVGGLPMESLEAMNWQSDWFVKIQNHQSEFEQTLDQLNQELQVLQQSESDYQFKAYYSNLRKSLLQKRLPKPSKLKKFAQHPSGNWIKEQFAQLASIQQQQQELQKEFVDAQIIIHVDPISVVPLEPVPDFLR